MAPKTEEEKAEMLRQQKEAEEQLQMLLGQSRPKNLREGVGSGLGNIVGGAVGAVGLIVVAPLAGMSEGAKGGGIIGGAVGLAGGAVAGVVGGAALAVGGVVSGVSQMIRGVAAVPSSISEPRKGKWWDENNGVWVETNLEAVALEFEKIPENDDDILAEARKEADTRASITGDAARPVADMYYYDILGVESNAEPSVIKRKYYIMARKYHPDKVGKDDVEAANKFKDAAEAYQVLSDPELRKKYDKEGREGLSADKTEAVNANNIDPAILFAFLFGSDRFKGYVGTLAMATAASVADSKKVSQKDAVMLQKRRCSRLAILLADRLSPWVKEDYDLAKTLWTTEAQTLVEASYGYELITLIGKVYSLAAAQFLGSLDSGIGMPGISKWAASHASKFQRGGQQNKQKMETLRAGLGMAQISAEAQKKVEQAKTDEERAAAQKMAEEEIGVATLKLMWTTTAVDITTTLHETCQMVLFDKSVDKKERKARGHGLAALGKIFMEIPAPKVDGEQPKDAKQLYEEAAFAAMLETVKRKEDSAFSASVRNL